MEHGEIKFAGYVRDGGKKSLIVTRKILRETWLRDKEIQLQNNEIQNYILDFIFVKMII
jgi:hypothetical protein